jgi:hypothetical protein
MKRHVFFSIFFFFQLSQALPVCPDPQTVLSERAQHLRNHLAEIGERCSEHPELKGSINSLISEINGVSMLIAPTQHVSAPSTTTFAQPPPASDENTCPKEYADALIDRLQNPQSPETRTLEQRITASYQVNSNCTSTSKDSDSNNFLPTALIAGAGGLTAYSLMNTSREPAIPHEESDEDEDENHTAERRPPAVDENDQPLNAEGNLPCPDVSRIPTGNSSPQVLILTNQSSKAAAENIIEAFFRHSIFTCLGRERFKIEIEHTNDLHCSITAVRAQSSTISCQNATFELANSKRAEKNAKTVLIVVENSDPAGSFHLRSFAGSNSGRQGVSVMTTALHRQGGVHEIMHAVGFEDAYSASQPPRQGGTIMNNLRYGYIPYAWWRRIISFFYDNQTEASISED